MKKGVVIILILVIGLPTLMAQNDQVKVNPVGTWKFDAPYAPEGYNSGIIIVGMTDQKQTTTMSFTGREDKLNGENVKAVNDSILFSIFVEGQDVRVMLKLENDTIMSGKAVYSEGEVPLFLTKTLTSGAEVKDPPVKN